MSGAQQSPTSPRFLPKTEQHHYSWDEATNDSFPGPSQATSKAPIRAASSPLPYKSPKSPRNFHVQVSSLYDSGKAVEPSLPPQRSPSVRSSYSSQSSSYSDAPLCSTATGRSARRCDPPRSPKITTTYANDDIDDDVDSTSSYYQTPTSGSRSFKGMYSQENSLESPPYGLLGGGPVAISPRRSPKSPRKFVFDAISPFSDPANKKFECYEPVSPAEEIRAARTDCYLEAARPLSPNIYEPLQHNSKKLMRSSPVDKMVHMSGAPPEISGKLKHNEWEMTVSPNLEEQNGLSSNDSFYVKRDSCVTESTQLSVESGETTNGTVATTATSLNYSDSSPKQAANARGRTPSPLFEHCEPMRKRRHAVNITPNPGYQKVLHGSHSTLDRTCSDSVVSLRCRKSTSDLTDNLDAELSKQKSSVDGSQGASNYQPRRRGSSKGGLAYLASRRSSRDSMKSACSNTSIFSNDDIGPLAFQASNRGRQRRTSNFLELPEPDHIRPRVCSLPDRTYNPRASDDLYRLRHFSISKGNVVNCGDSIISRRSRSNTSVNSTNSRASERSPFDGSCCGGGYANVDSFPASPTDDSDNLEPPPPARYRVVMIGDAGVGKTALVNQFMTSEYMHTYDASLDDEFGEKTVSVLLDDEESELVFIDHPSAEMSVENSLSTYEPHGCVVVFSVVDKTSFRVAEEIINYLWQENYMKDKAVILVGNKADLARARVITSQEGKALAASRDAKFIETSSGIQHNVDELLVGILKQMRLKESREKKATSSKMKTSRTHISLHLAKEILQKICLSDISKSKSCENLHVL